MWREVEVVGVGNVASLFSARAFVWGDVDPHGGGLGAVGFDSRIFFPGWQVTRVSPYVRGPFPTKGMIPARPLYQGGRGSVWDPAPSKERVGDWDGPATVWSLLCVAETRATRPNGELGYNTRSNSGPRVPSGGVTLKRCCTYRPSVIYLIVNKRLSLSISLSLSLSLSFAAFPLFLFVASFVSVPPPPPALL